MLVHAAGSKSKSWYKNSFGCRPKIGKKRFPYNFVEIFSQIGALITTTVVKLNLGG